MKVFKYGRKNPWLPTLIRPFPNSYANAGSWLATENALYYCAQSANSISWVLILDPQIQSSLDIHVPRIRSSRYSWPLDQIIQIFATPTSNHPQIFVPPGSDHPDIRGPRSNHPKIFVLPGASHPDIHNPWPDHPQLFGTHLFISWWLEPNFHQRLFEKLVSHRLFILLCYGYNWKWLPPFLV